MSNPQYKLCRDCLHVVKQRGRLHCSHPKMPPGNLATGELESAYIAREYSDSPCGRSARLFEERPLLLTRINDWLIGSKQP